MKLQRRKMKDWKGEHIVPSSFRKKKYRDYTGVDLRNEPRAGKYLDSRDGTLVWALEPRGKFYATCRFSERRELYKPGLVILQYPNRQHEIITKYTFATYYGG